MIKILYYLLFNKQNNNKDINNKYVRNRTKSRIRRKGKFNYINFKNKAKTYFKDIYFLDNIDYIDLNGEEHLHDNLKELNTGNVDLYINGIKCEFKKYFIPETEGEYSIKLKFKNNIKDCKLYVCRM